MPEAVPLVLPGSWERRRRRPETAYETGYVKYEELEREGGDEDGGED